MRRKHVYMSHPLSAPSLTERLWNRFKASGLVAAATVEAERAGAPIVPCAPWLHLAEFWTEEEGRELGLTIDTAAIDRCDELWMLGPIQPPSKGMQIEINHARALGLPIIDRRR